MMIKRGLVVLTAGLLSASVVAQAVGKFKNNTVSKPGAAREETPVELSDPAKPIIVNADSPTFTLTLKSNSTTGYSWYLLGDYNSELLEPEKQTYYSAKTDLVGAPGYEVFTFKVKDQAFNVPQQFTINLQNIRPWVAVNNTQKMTFTIITTQKSLADPHHKNKRKPE